MNWCPITSRPSIICPVCGDVTESWNQEIGKTAPYPVPAFRWTAADGEMIGGFEKMGIEAGKMPMARYRKCLTTGTCKYCPFGSRFSGQTIMDDLRHDSRNINFEVRTNSPTIRIMANSRKHVAGVEYLDADTGEVKQALAGTTIICAGAYESPKLMMLSTSRYWKQGIGNDHDQLGRYVVSHSMLKVRGKLNHNKEQWFQEYDFPTLMSRTYDTEEYQKQNKIFLFKNRALPNFDIAGMMQKGYSRAKIDKLFMGSREQELQAFMEEKGRFENRLTLAPGKNRFGLPKMKIEFNRTEDATRNGENWLKLMKKVINAMGYKNITKYEIQDPGGHHLTGTCRMSETPELGVLDADMRVHNMDNLYVCSNASFPTGSAVNPTLTLTAMAFRLGDHLLNRK